MRLSFPSDAAKPEVGATTKAANEQLTRSAEFFHGIIDTVREPLLVLDNELRVISANKPFLSTFHVTPDQTINRFVHDLGNGQWNIPTLRGLLERVLSNNEEVKGFELEHDFESIGVRTMVLNARLLIPANGEPPRLLLAIDDVTERKRAETVLIKSEKLAAAGRLAAVLAHEINNPLQAVTNLMELLKQAPDMDAPHREYARMAADELSRVSRMTQQSLAFYPESTSPTTVNLEEVIESILNIYAKRIGTKNLTVIKQYKFEGAEIVSHPGDVRQLISTLLINALEAVPAAAALCCASANPSMGARLGGEWVVFGSSWRTTVAESRLTTLLASSTRSLPRREKAGRGSVFG